MGGFHTLVVLDLHFVEGPGSVLKADRYLIVAPGGLQGSLGELGNRWGPRWTKVANGAVYVDNETGVQPAPPDEQIIAKRPLKSRFYHWDQGVQYSDYWFILILPPGMTLKSANPLPTWASDLGDRFSIFWESRPRNGNANRTVDISWELAMYTDQDREREVLRLRSLLPQSTRKWAAIFRVANYTKRGLAFLFLLIALIAGWISLPSGLAISPPKISPEARIPATVIFFITLGLSLMGLFGWSLPDFLHLGGSSKRRG